MTLTAAASKLSAWTSDDLPDSAMSSAALETISPRSPAVARLHAPGRFGSIYTLFTNVW
jgi:hypothetical protein